MILNYTDFTDDEEKMKDFFYLSKERFLESYSYLTEEEYNLTLKKVNDLASSKILRSACKDSQAV